LALRALLRDRAESRDEALGPPTLEAIVKPQQEGKLCDELLQG